MPNPVLLASPSASTPTDPLWEINARAAARYIPQPYEGDIVLLSAQRNEEVPHDAFVQQADVWRELAREVQVIETPGSHRSMMIDEADVAPLAEKLNDLLDG